MIGDHDIPVPSVGVATTSVAGTIVLYDGPRNASHVLNASAALIWSAIDGELDVGRIVARVAQEAGVDLETVDLDVRAAVGQLAGTGVVSFVGTSDPTPPATPAAAADADAGDAFEGVTWCPALGPRQVAGTTVEVRTDVAALHADFREVLACLPEAPTAAVTLSVVDQGAPNGRPFGIFVDSTEVQRASTSAAAADLAFAQLNRVAVARTPDRFRLHGGAVERDGTVVMVLGPSGHGKSTLTAALVQHGFAYLTDEVVVIDPVSWAVTPYPKALDLGPGSLRLLGIDDESVIAGRKSKVLPGHLGSVATGGQLGLVVVLAAADESGAEPSIRLDPPTALIEVLANTFAETMTLPDALDRLAALCETVPVVRLARLPLDDACAEIDRLLT